VYAYCVELAGKTQAGLYTGLAFMLLGAPKVFSNTLLGRWSDRFGRRPLLIVSSLGTLTSSVLWAVTPNIGVLLLSRAIAGTFGGQATLSAAVVADVHPPQRRSAGMGALGAAFGCSMIFGPLVGGYVAAYASHAGVGWVGAALQVLSLLTAALILPETRPARPPTSESGSAPTSARALLAQPSVFPLLASTFLVTFAVAEFTTTFPALAENHYAFTEREAGYAFSLFGLIGTLLQGGALRPLVRLLGERNLAMIGQGLLAASLAGLALLPPEGLLWVLAGFVGAGVAFTTPTITALVSVCVGPQQQGALLGLHQSVTALGRSGGAALAGWMFGIVGARPPYTLAAGLSFVAGALLIYVPTRVGYSVFPATADN
jgi:MFS family permease